MATLGFGIFESMKPLFIILFILLIGKVKVLGQDTLIIQTTNVLEKYECFCPKAKKGGVFRTIDEVKSNISICKYIDRKCNNVILDSLKIDFLKNSFIAFDFLEGPCNLSDVKTILYKLPNLKKYFFIIKINILDDSKVGNYVPIRELTPKLESNYTFEYKVER